VFAAFADVLLRWKRNKVYPNNKAKTTVRKA
jgi:hypothetical protein